MSFTMRDLQPGLKLLFLGFLLLHSFDSHEALSQTDSQRSENEVLKEFENRFAVYLLNREDVEVENGFSVQVHLSGIAEGPSSFTKGATFTRFQERFYRLIHKDNRRRSDGFSKNLLLLDIGTSESDIQQLAEFVFTDEVECMIARGSNPTVSSFQNKLGTAAVPFDVYTGIVSPFEYSICNGDTVDSQRVHVADYKFPRCLGKVDVGGGKYEFFMLTKYKNTVIAVTFLDDPSWLPIKTRVFRIDDDKQKQELKNLKIATVEAEWNLVSVTLTDWQQRGPNDIQVPARVIMYDEAYGVKREYKMSFRDWTFDKDIDPILLEKEKFRGGDFRKFDQQGLVKCFKDIPSIFDLKK
jgi:hypothetical protein